VKLIGMYDSPYVRRVAITARCYGVAYTHVNWSVFADAERVRQYNPLGRVPVLVLESGEALVESTAILDYLDELAGSEVSLMPTAGSERRRELKLCSVAMGACDKAVALFYERNKRTAESRDPGWETRLDTQLRLAADFLESEAPSLAANLRASQVACAVMMRFVHEYLGDDLGCPRLKALAAQCEERQEFLDVPFAG